MSESQKHFLGDEAESQGFGYVPVGATYVPPRHNQVQETGSWRVLFARYSEAGWEFGERVVDADGCPTLGPTGEVLGADG